MITRIRFLLIGLAVGLPFILLVVVGLALRPAPTEGPRTDEILRVVGWMVTRDLAQTSKSFVLGTEVFDFSRLPEAELTGVMRMLYKWDDDVDQVVLLNEKDQPVYPPISLTAEQIKPGTETSGRIPVEGDSYEHFLRNLPLEAAREKGKTFSGVYVDKKRNTALIAGAIAVHPPEGGLPWVLAFERSLRRIQQIIATSLIFADQIIFVVDSGGRLVAHPNGERFLSRESLSEHPLVTKFLAGEPSGSLGWTQAGKDFHGAFLRLDLMDWAVMIEGPALPVQARSQLGWGWVLFLLMLIVPAGFVTLWLTRRSGVLETKVQSLQDDERQRAEELRRIQSSLLEARKLNAIGDLGAGVAHEFNNPLGGILGLTQLLLRKKKENDPDFQFLKRIEEEGRRCKAITDNLLRFSEQQLANNWEPLRVDRVLDSTMQLITRKLEEQGIRIDRRFATEIPRIWGKEGEIQRAFLNVLFNAETAMPDGGTITLIILPKGDFVEVRIADTGRGIASENLERVFEPFFTTKDNWRGPGLGLWVVYQIMQDHKGNVRIESEVGKGTIVVFQFLTEQNARPADQNAPVLLA